MIRHIVLSTACALGALGVASAETRSFELSGFTKVRGTAAVDVIVEVGPSFSVKAESDGDIDEAEARVDGDMLVLSRESDRGFNMKLRRSSSITYRVTLPEIDGAESAAGSDVRVQGIDSRNLELSASSGSDLIVSGTCGTLKISASSGGDVKGYDLACDDVTARASSGGGIEITARDGIDARASSGADIDVRGKPERQRTKESSGGDVSVRS
jgi:hypothetical protein